MKTIEKILWVISILAFIVGAIGLVQYLLAGHTQVSYGSYIPWGLWVAVYVYLVWLEVGSMLAYTLLVYVFGLRPLAAVGKTIILVALSILIGALAQIGLDLGHPFRFWHALIYADFGSPMAWMIWLHLIYFVLLAVELWFDISGKAKNWSRRLALVSLPVGAALVTVVGSIFGVVAGRGFWNASMLPISFLFSALVVGTALVTLTYLLAAPDKESEAYQATKQLLARVTLGVTLCGLFAAGINALTTSYSNVPAQAEALRVALFGDFWWGFWILHIGLGTLVPIILLAWRSNSSLSVGVASGLIAAMFIVVPFSIIVPTLTLPEFKALTTAYIGPGLIFRYSPTPTEFLVTAWVLSLVALAILIGNRFLVSRKLA